MDVTHSTMMRYVGGLRKTASVRTEMIRNSKTEIQPTDVGTLLFEVFLHLLFMAKFRMLT